MNVYDFDETIYDGESSIEFILAYLKKDPTVVRFLPSIAKLMFRYNRGKATFEDFTRDYAPVLQRYFAENNVDLMALVSGFWDKRMHKIKPFYRERQQEDDVIITASPYFMMDDVCERLGVRHLPRAQGGPLPRRLPGRRDRRLLHRFGERLVFVPAREARLHGQGEQDHADQMKKPLNGAAFSNSEFKKRPAGRFFI